MYRIPPRGADRTRLAARIFDGYSYMFMKNELGTT